MRIWTPVFANDLDAFVPELWAQEGLLLLENQMVVGNLVHRNFENQLASFGDVVNTRLPASFTGARKVDTDSVTIQDATVTNVAVPLNQHLHTSFLVRDGEETKGFVTLRENLLAPAMLSLAQMVDEIVLAECYQFLGNNVGQLTVTPTASTIISLRSLMNQNKVPMEGRNLVVAPETEAAFLGLELFTSAEKVGDNGTALREASLGRKFGINHWMSQNVPSIAVGSQTQAAASPGAINLAAGYAAGSSVLTVDGFTGAVVTGQWCLIAGDGIPHRITAHSETAGDTTSITISPVLKRAVVDDAVVVVFEHGEIDLAAGYASGWSKSMVVDGFAAADLSTGQLVSFANATGATYGLISTPTSTSILLNRPTEAALADNDDVFPGPWGTYNFAFHRNALALVTRPLAAPAAGTGALSFTASYNGLSMRVTITYDGDKQGHLVTCDLLCGIKVLDTSLGAVLLA